MITTISCELPQLPRRIQLKYLEYRIFTIPNIRYSAYFLSLWLKIHVSVGVLGLGLRPPKPQPILPLCL